MRRFRPRLEAIEARITPATIPDGAILLPTGGDRVRLIDPLDGTDLGELTPFPGFAGEVRAATGDLTGDGTPELIVAAGPGGTPLVRVLNGRSLAPVTEFLAFEESFRGGVYVAAGDVNRDGYADVIVGAGEGGSARVRVFDGTNLKHVLVDRMVFEPTFRGGVRVAAGDVDGDGAADIVAGAGPGGAPRVVVFRPGGELASFFAYDADLRAGVDVATTGEGTSLATATFTLGTEAKVVTAPGAGGAPHVKVFDGAGGEWFSFYAGDESARGGLRLTGFRDGIIAAAPTVTGPDLRLVTWTGGQEHWALPPGTMRVVGTIDAVDAAAGTVGIATTRGAGITVVVSADAIVKRNLDAATFGDLRAGDRVTAKLTGGRVTAIEAREITLVRPVPAVPSGT